MTTNERINELLATPMDRAGFLKLVGGLIVGLIGLGGFLKLVELNKAPSTHANGLEGYGSTPYGK
jgi:hypothetical protein